MFNRINLDIDTPIKCQYCNNTVRIKKIDDRYKDRVICECVCNNCNRKQLVLLCDKEYSIYKIMWSHKINEGE